MKKTFLFVSMISLSFGTVLNYAASKTRKTSLKQAVSAFANTCVLFTIKYGPFEGLINSELVKKTPRSISMDDIEAQNLSLKNSCFSSKSKKE